jgi:hypothetical protein
MINRNRRILPVAIFLMSFCLLLLEIFMTRIFSVALYYHFAFMAISVALLGLGISGMAVYLFPKFFSKKNSYLIMTWSSVLFSIFVLGALLAIMFFQLELDVTMSSLFNLAGLYIFLIFPFFFGGLVISLILTHFSKKVSKLYFYDLIGASLGAVGVIFLLKYTGGPNGLILIALLGILNALILSIYFKFKKSTKAIFILAIAVLILFIIGMSMNAFTLEFTRGSEDGEKQYSEWNAISRIDLYGNDDGKIILIDSDASTSVLRIDDDITEVSDISNEIHALVYQIKSDSEALIIGVGGGKDVITALLSNNTVIGVEINDLIINDLMFGILSDFSGNLYSRDDVTIVLDEGRSYIRSSDEKYDVIQMSLVDTWAATAAGAFTLTENNLYTVEAFVEYITHLEDDGVFTSTRYTYEKPQETVRLIGIALEAMDQIGIENPEDNIVLIKEKLIYPEGVERPRTPIEGTANFMVKRSAFTEEEVTTLEEKAEEQGYEVIYNPFEEQDNVFNDLILSEDRDLFYANYSLDVTPPTDNKPFFFYTLKFGDTLDLFKLTSGEYESEIFLKTNLGLFILLGTFLLTLILAVIFLLGPLLFMKIGDLKTNRSSKLIILLYFAALGLGFILIEIAMMQKFILFLGHPIYALGVILASLLVFSGIGSYTTDKIKKEDLKKCIGKNLIYLIVLVLIYLAILQPIFTAFIGNALTLRIIIAIILLCPLGIVMGRFFPLGIKYIDEDYHQMIPWAWSVNGTTSVVGSVVAILLAINLGFNLTILIGLIAYLFTLGLILKKK